MKRPFILLYTLLAICLLPICVSAQGQGVIEPSVQPNAGPGDAESQIYTAVEQEARFEGNLPQFLGQNLRYPDDAREAGIEGMVQAKFVVNEDGSISNITISKTLSSSCDKEVIRVLKLMPKWKPAFNKGKAVKCYYLQPVSFKLQ